MGKKGELAEQYFRQGYNCCQSVAAAFAAEMGVSEQTALTLSCGLGGGVGRLRQVCGAFLGATMALSGYYTDAADPQDKSRIYAMVQELAEQYKQQNGGNSIICRELLGLDKAAATPPQAEARTAAYYHKRPCPQLVRLAADLTEQYLAAHPKEKA